MTATAPCPVSDQQGRCLDAAARGPLFASLEYGAVRYFTTRPEPDASAVFRTDDVHECLVRDWVRWADDRRSVSVTEAGRSALAAYRRHVQHLGELPYTVTRNPLRGDLHRPDEPARILRDSRTGREIRPGDRITDPSGRPVTYLGPTMSRAGADGAWRPGRVARVLYDADTSWLFLPAHIGAAYDDMPTAGGN
ncbi:hypothetical protein ACFVIM_30700 [Streptomyces sp. NPDC057638]|uniref:hypothetical protein n=1 Tax=Streptomyces sp. NPDC057638 TaxID=3346190 RepID=UPI003673C207